MLHLAILTEANGVMTLQVAKVIPSLMKYETILLKEKKKVLKRVLPKSIPKLTPKHLYMHPWHIRKFLQGERQ